MSKDNYEKTKGWMIVISNEKYRKKVMRLYMKRIFCVLFLCITFFPLLAQGEGVVSVISSASANSEEKAITHALRNAIEQTYGSFISSNTTILNDELIADEVVSISSGNIEGYSIISSTLLPNNDYQVVINAHISIGKLVSFVKSHGGTIEFEGKSFVENIKLMEFREKNTWQEIKNLLAFAQKCLSEPIFNYEMILSEPAVITSGADKGKYLLKATIEASSGASSKSFYSILRNTLDNLALKDDKEVESFKHYLGEPYFNKELGLFLPLRKTLYWGGLREFLEELFNSIYQNLFFFTIKGLDSDYSFEPSNSYSLPVFWVHNIEKSNRDLLTAMHTNDYRYLLYSPLFASLPVDQINYKTQSIRNVWDGTIEAYEIPEMAGLDENTKQMIELKIDEERKTFKGGWYSSNNPPAQLRYVWFNEALETDYWQAYTREELVHAFAQLINDKTLNAILKNSMEKDNYSHAAKAIKRGGKEKEEIVKELVYSFPKKDIQVKGIDIMISFVMNRETLMHTTAFEITPQRCPYKHHYWVEDRMEKSFITYDGMAIYRK